ncbi:PRA1 family protein F4-like protein [Drosera capensis]
MIILNKYHFRLPYHPPPASHPVFSISSLSVPVSLCDTTTCLSGNLALFRTNYLVVSLFILLISLVYHPISLIVLLVALLAWFFLYFSRDVPLRVFDLKIDERMVMVGLGVLTVVALAVVAAAMSAVMVRLHGFLRFRALGDKAGCWVPGWRSSRVCMDDVNFTTCQSCIAEAKDAIAQLCHQSKKGPYDSDFFHKIGTENEFFSFSFNNVSDPALFNAKTNELLSSFSQQGSINPTLCATGLINYDTTKVREKGMTMVTD